MLDVLLSLVLILLLSPVLAIIALILRFTGEGDVLFNQPRVGLNQVEFRVHKFVTMKRGSERISTITEKRDPRILPFGRILRFTKLNEFPQLFNVFKGEMSFVGPRPLSRENFNSYPEGMKDQIYIGIKPGITGIGSVLFRHEEDILFRMKTPKEMGYADIMKVKGKAELWYREKRNLLIDIALLTITGWAILFPRSELLFLVFRHLPFKDEYLSLKQMGTPLRDA
jgi:lipopolysaccharide/colanic/teichoic acid biosynthesis glycosyltransferase